MPAPSFAAVDWGTSSFRLWLLAADGAVLGERKGDLGMTRLTPDGYEGVLEHNLATLGAPSHLPVVICGMAGAAQGWRPAPYLDLPADLRDIGANATRVTGAARDIRILPGVAQRRPGAEDVMRGEETILLGAIALEGVEGLICMPGTHSKWVRIERGTITGYSSWMTGEAFALFSQHSTLSHFMAADGADVAEDPAFAEAVKDAATRPERMLNLLFSVRARPLVDPGAAPAMKARLSGLLIGQEIGGMKLDGSEPVTLISGGVLARNYRHAFEILGLEHRFIEADDMARAGLAHVGRRLWPQAENQRGAHA